MGIGDRREKGKMERLGTLGTGGDGWGRGRRLEAVGVEREGLETAAVVETVETVEMAGDGWRRWRRLETAQLETLETLETTEDGRRPPRRLETVDAASPGVPRARETGGWETGGGEAGHGRGWGGEEEAGAAAAEGE